VDTVKTPDSPEDAAGSQPRVRWTWGAAALLVGAVLVVLWVWFPPVWLFTERAIVHRTVAILDRVQSGGTIDPEYIGFGVEGNEPRDPEREVASLRRRLKSERWEVIGARSGGPSGSWWCFILFYGVGSSGGDEELEWIRWGIYDDGPRILDGSVFVW